MSIEQSLTRQTQLTVSGWRAFAVTMGMKYPTGRSALLVSTLLLAALFALPGCSRAPELPPKEIQISGNDEMKFDLNAFEVKAGQKVTVTMRNAGTMPKEAMGHNFVLLAKNTDVPKFIEAGQPNAASEFIASAQAFHVLGKTKILGPGESDSVTFTAPTVPGPYDYICTFPGHYVSGMKGVMTVTQPNS